MIVLECCLDDHASGRDMRPLHGNTQPVVTGAPAPRTNQHIVLILSQEPAVDLFDLVGDIGILGSGEVVAGLDIDHINDILGDAMT